MVDGYRAKTGIQMTAYTYYGARHTTSNRLFNGLRRHEGPEDSRAGCAGLHGHAEGMRRQPDADAFAEGLSRAAERHRGSQKIR